MMGTADEIDRYECFLRWYERTTSDERAMGLAGGSEEALRKTIHSLLPGECQNMTAGEARDYCVRRLSSLGKPWVRR